MGCCCAKSSTTPKQHPADSKQSTENKPNVHAAQETPQVQDANAPKVFEVVDTSANPLNDAKNSPSSDDSDCWEAV